MIIESLPIQEIWHPLGLRGKFSLSHLADTSTIQIMVSGNTWQVYDFTIFGDPIFSAEQYDEFLLLEKYANAPYLPFAKRKRLNATIRYEPLKLAVSRSEIDTEQGIRNSLYRLANFHEMLLKRRFYYNESTCEILDEFVLFGRYLLDKFGNFWQIQKKITVSNEQIVCKRAIFEETYGNGYVAIKDFPFPKPATLCPLCGRPFLFKDFVRNEPFQFACWSVAHSPCPTDPHF